MLKHRCLCLLGSLKLIAFQLSQLGLALDQAEAANKNETWRHFKVTHQLVWSNKSLLFFRGVLLNLQHSNKAKNIVLNCMSSLKPAQNLLQHPVVLPANDHCDARSLPNVAPSHESPANVWTNFKTWYWDKKYIYSLLSKCIQMLPK